MKKIKFLIPILALTLFSCSDYLDTNESPNNPNGQLVTPNLSLAATQANSYRTVATKMNRLGNFFMNNWGMNVNSFAATSPQEFSLSLDNSFYTGIWDNTYRNTADYTLIINHPAANYENHKAIAKIMKAYHFQYLVDIYGDIPYFEAHQGTAELTPAYDDSKAIYRDLYTQLEDAIATIDNPSATTIAVGSEDVILGGDMQTWKKFANTLKLRILLRQSELTDAETTTYLADKFAELASASFISSSVTINPGYSTGNTTQQNPFYSQMYQVDGTTENNEFRFVRASKYMADKLNSTPVDPRRSRLFALVGGTVQGVLQGDLSVSNGGTAPASISSLGTGVVSSSSQNGFIMLLSESLLLQAEAVHKGYLTGNAQALFDAAISASMTQLGATAGNYVSEVNLIVGKGYGAIGATSAQQLEAIFYQKNIALQGGVNSMESFIEYTRTGLIDTIPLAISGVTKPNKPRRLLYPSSELVGNSANVPSQTVNDVFTTGPFWYQ